MRRPFGVGANKGVRIRFQPFVVLHRRLPRSQDPDRHPGAGLTKRIAALRRDARPAGGSHDARTNVATSGPDAPSTIVPLESSKPALRIGAGSARKIRSRHQSERGDAHRRRHPPGMGISEVQWRSSTWHIADRRRGHGRVGRRRRRKQRRQLAGAPCRETELATGNARRDRVERRDRRLGRRCGAEP